MGRTKYGNNIVRSGVRRARRLFLMVGVANEKSYGAKWRTKDGPGVDAYRRSVVRMVCQENKEDQ